MTIQRISTPVRVGLPAARHLALIVREQLDIGDRVRSLHAGRTGTVPFLEATDEHLITYDAEDLGAVQRGHGWPNHACRSPQNALRPRDLQTADHLVLRAQLLMVGDLASSSAEDFDSGVHFLTVKKYSLATSPAAQSRNFSFPR